MNRWMPHRVLAAWWVCLAMSPAWTQGDALVQFERMWPALQQPWYFYQPSQVATDSQGNVYVVDSEKHTVQKFTSDGQFVTRWGSEGASPGEFDQPTGVAVDEDGNVYVTDTYNSRVQKFTADGQFVLEWGSSGSGIGEFNGPTGIVADHAGRLFVSDAGNNRIVVFSLNGDFLLQWGGRGAGEGKFQSPAGIAADGLGSIFVADHFNNRIQRFDPMGAFLGAWGSMGTGEGQFDGPYGVVSDGNGRVYVADTGNNRIQVFQESGQFVTAWGSRGKGNGNFRYPIGIAIGAQGAVYVAERNGFRVQKFTHDGRFVAVWGSKGTRSGFLDSPWGVAVNPNGDIYVADTVNSRIQRFTSDGRFVLAWGSDGTDPGQFKIPAGLAVDSAGDVYVVDYWTSKVQRFTSEGEFIASWGSSGTGDGQFRGATGVAVDKDGNVLVADTVNGRVIKFSNIGDVLDSWGSPGSGPGELDYPAGIVVDNEGAVYVVDSHNHRVQKFDSDGILLTTWGTQGAMEGQFLYPRGIALDAESNVLIADTDNHRIQMFDSEGAFIGMWGEIGSAPGQFVKPGAVAFNIDGRILVADTFNSRIQAFQPSALGLGNKAVIVLAGTPSVNGSAWNSMAMCANLAYRALMHQGYGKDDIYFLSHDTDLDLDSNGFPDDVDGIPTSDILDDALRNWSADAHHVLLYMIGVGLTDGLALNESESLHYEVLNSWISELESRIPGMVAVVYDAGNAGGMLPALAHPSRPRVLISSTGLDENAHFLSSGTVSFSNHFWIAVFNGTDLYSSFTTSKAAMGDITAYQSPEIDDNGNGIGNESEDGEIARELFLFNRARAIDEAPTVGEISPPQELEEDQTEASFFAEVADDGETIARVWAIVIPPTGIPDAPTSEVLDSMGFELEYVGEGRYEGVFDEFVESGEYTVDFFVLDGNLNISEVERTTIRKTALPGMLAGRVLNAATGEGLLLALVKLDGSKTTQTDAAGYYIYVDVIAGTHEVTASADGFKQMTKWKWIGAGDIAELDFELQLQGGGDPGPNGGCNADGNSSLKMHPQAEQLRADCIPLLVAVLCFIVWRVRL